MSRFAPMIQILLDAGTAELCLTVDKSPSVLEGGDVLLLPHLNNDFGRSGNFRERGVSCGARYRFAIRVVQGMWLFRANN